MATTNDILMTSPDGSVGSPGVAATPANPDYAGQPAAAAGSVTGGSCKCAANGLAAGSGNHGNTGGPGSPGQPAPTLGFIVGRLLSDIAIQSSGGAGGPGGPGSNGTNGGTGQDAGTNVPNCLKPGWFSPPACTPAVGGRGGDAGHGGDGGPGGNGGNGGDIYYYYTEAQGTSPDGTAYQIMTNSLGGQVGTGGAPGNPGTFGPGGKNESRTPTPNAPNGNPNQGGSYGRNGINSGQPGNVAGYNVPSSNV